MFIHDQRKTRNKRIMDIALSYTPHLDKNAKNSLLRKILLHRHQILHRRQILLRCQIPHRHSLGRILDRTPGLGLFISPRFPGVMSTLVVSLIISIVVVVAVNIIDNLPTDQTTD
jgi:hypothetical protein